MVSLSCYNNRGNCARGMVYTTSFVHKHTRCADGVDLAKNNHKLVQG